MLTEFGKVMRIIRINTGDSMRDMAAKIGMSATYLSAIETGKRNIPSNMEELLFTHYNFSEKDKKRIKDAIAESTSQVKIDLTEMAEKQKKIIYSVAKGEIDEATLDKLCDIIKNKEKMGKFFGMMKRKILIVICYILILI